MSTWLTSWQANKHGTERQLMLTNNLKNIHCGWETTSVCVPQTCYFLFFSMCVCDWGPPKVYSSVLLMCCMSQGRALVWSMGSLPLSVWCGLITGRGRGCGKTPFMPQSIHFDLTRWCNADQQTGENVNVTVCVAVCLWRGTCARVCVHTCLCGLSMHPLSIASNMYYAHL